MKPMKFDKRKCICDNTDELMTTMTMMTMMMMMMLMMIVNMVMTMTKRLNTRRGHNESE